MFCTWSPCTTIIAGEAGKPRVGHPPKRRRNGAARSGGDKFAIDMEVKHIYPIELMVRTPGLPVWMDNGGHTKQTYQELAQRLKGVVMTAMAKGGEGTKVALMTWHRRLVHLSFKTVVELAPEWREWGWSLLTYM